MAPSSKYDKALSWLSILRNKSLCFKETKCVCCESKFGAERMCSQNDSLDERGYNAIDQMVGYILSGDPSYITSHNNARNIIGRIERDDLVEELIKAYLDK